LAPKPCLQLLEHGGGFGLPQYETTIEIVARALVDLVELADPAEREVGFGMIGFSFLELTKRVRPAAGEHDGRVYQQTFIDTYSKVAFTKLYDRKTPLTAADLLNDRVVPFFDEHDIPLCRVLTDRGTEYCGNPEHHEYELYLAVEDIEHTRTKVKRPQTNGICERFHRTVLDEFFRVAFRKKLYGSIAELQADLDAWMRQYNEERPHQGGATTVTIPIRRAGPMEGDRAQSRPNPRIRTVAKVMPIA
jgi:transposase InsO family protein